jgi:Nuclease-related domain/AAA domain
MSGVRIWPSILPQQVRENSLRSAEVRVYDLLAEKLGPGWVVFYSRPWLGLTPSGEEKDGECDFVVMHPAHGYLAIEVKGGGISYDPETNQWLSRDRDGIRHKIKNPIGQAVASKHELLKKVKELDSWHGRYVRQRHGVIFTDTESPPHNLGPDGPREIFCCRKELPDIARWIKERLSGASAADLGGDGVRAFEELLASPLLLRVPLAHYLDDDEQAIAALTPEQFHILDSVQHLERVGAGGGAGTGKTIVAMEDAVRLSRRGLKTMLLCFSVPLAGHIRERLSKTEPSIVVRSLAELCAELGDRSGKMPAGPTGAEIEQAIDRLLHAVREDPSLRFDAIIVDEAQDFRTHWWIAVDELLRDTKQSSLHAYFDTNQSIYGDIAKELKAFQIIPIHLTRNLRNTRAIHAKANRFYKGIPILADGPAGMEVEWHPCPTARIAEMAASSARRLTITEKVLSEDIVILTVNDTMLGAVRNRSGFPQGVSVSTVKNFKGLERKVIILAADREIADEPELAYISLSRPRTHLVVIGEPEILSWLGMP